MYTWTQMLHDLEELHELFPLSVVINNAMEKALTHVKENSHARS